MAGNARQQEFRRAVGNSVNHCKKSMLDFLDYQRDMAIRAFPGQEGDIREFFKFMVVRVHNDVSLIGHQVMAAFGIYENGGIIPPFGRTDEERARAVPRDANGQRLALPTASERS